MTMTKDYPILKFPVWLNPTTKVNINGYLISEWLAVTYTDPRCKSISIINCYGYEVTKVRFETFDDGIQFAHFLAEHYQDYFMLWYENQKADVPGLTRYTIQHGLDLYDIFSKFDSLVITFQDVMDEYTRYNS